MAKAKAAAKPAGKSSVKKMTKSGLIQAIAEGLSNEVSKTQVKTVLDVLAEVAHKELKKSGVFTLPGFAKFVVVKKPPRPERTGRNPFTGQEQVFPAKPATKTVRARPIKALKDAVV